MSKSLKSFALVSLVLSLTCGVGFAASDVVVKHTLAQTTTASDSKVEGDKLFQEGVQQFRRGEYPKALQTYQRVLEIRRKLGDKVGEAATLNKLGEIYNGLNQPTQALEVLQQAVNLYKEIGDKTAVGEVLDNIGTSHRLKFDHSKALEFYQQALIIRKQIQDRQGEGKTLSNIGLTYTNQQQYSKALEILQQALAIHKEVKDRYWEAYTLMRIGIAYGDSRNYQREWELYKQSLTLHRELRNKDGEFRTLSNMGWHHYNQKDYVKSIDFWEQALVVVRQVQNKSLEAITLSSIGDAYSNQKKHEKAVEMYQLALSIAKLVPSNKSQEANIIAGIGDTYKNQEKYELALKYYQQALTITREAQDKSREAAILHMMGNIYLNQKQYNQAIEKYEQALPVARDIKDKSREANILTVMGDAYKLQEKYEPALKYYQQALIAATEVNDKSLEAAILHMIGNIYFSQKQYSQAIKIYEQALLVAREAKDKSREANILVGIGDTYKQQQKYDRAVAIYQQALPLILELKDKPYQANFYLVLGESHLAQDQDDEAIALFKQALSIYQTLNDKEGELTSVHKMSLAYSSKATDLFVRELYAQAKVEYSHLIEISQKVIIFARKLNRPEIEASSLGNLASAYAFFGEDDKAIETALQSANIAKKSKALSTEATALSILGNIYNQQGEYTKKLEIDKRLLEVHKKNKYALGQVSTLNAIAGTYNFFGQHEKAVEIYSQALDLARKIDIKILAPNSKKHLVLVENSALDGLKHSYSLLGQSNKALYYAQQAVKNAQTSAIPEYNADALISLAALYTNDFKDFPKAIDTSKEALIIAQQIKEFKIEAKVLQQLSDTYMKQGNYASALESAEQLLNIAKRVESPSLEKDALNNLRDIYFNQGNYPKSLEIAQQNLKMVQSKIPGYEVLVLLNLVENYIYVGDISTASETAQKALSIAKQQSNSIFEVGSLIYLSKVYKFLGEYSKGITTAEQALNISYRTNSFIYEIESIAALATIYEATGQYQQITALGEPLLGKIQKLNNPVRKAEVLIVIGKAYGLTGQYTKGKQLVEQGLTTARELKNPLLEVYALTALGSIYNSLNDYGQALDLTQQSLKIAQPLKSPIIQVDTLYFLGEIYSKLGDYKNSAKYYEQALTIVKQFNNRKGEGTLLLALTSNYFYQGETNKAIDSATKALAIFTNIKEPRLEALAKLILSASYGESKDDAKAMESAQAFLDFARKNKNSVWEKLALSNIGSLHRKFGRTEQAIVAYQQALVIKTDNQVKGANAGIYAGLAQVYQNLNQPNVAITYYKESVNRLEEIRSGIEGLPKELQNSFLNSTFDLDKVKVSDIYRQLAELLIKQGRDKEALYVQELLRGQEIRESTNTRSSPTEKIQIPLTETEQKVPALNESIIALGYQITECESITGQECSQLKQKRSELITQHMQQLKGLNKLISENRRADDVFFNPKDLGDIQEIVEATRNTVMIYPLVGERELHIQLYGKEGVVKTISVPVGRVELGNAVKEFRSLMEKCEKLAYCGGEDITKVKAASKKLYDWLIKPIDKELNTNPVENLVFALDRVTRYIPTSALFDGNQYLIEKYSIYVAPSAELTDISKPSPSLSIGDTYILGMGLSDSVPQNGSIPAFKGLKSVPEELDFIVKEQNNSSDQQGIYNGKSFLNSQFNFSTIENNLKGKNVLHLATHGVFDSNSPQQSYILLGDKKLLNPNMIQTLVDLKYIHLVVLSACQTALASPNQEGIEINAFAHHFLRRGAKSVMASLWKVDDPSTAKIMQLFYKNLATGKMTKSQALRQAQLCLLSGNCTGENGVIRGAYVDREQETLPRSEQRKSSYSHPYYWAPFILIGNGL